MSLLSPHAASSFFLTPYRSSSPQIPSPPAPPTTGDRALYLSVTERQAFLTASNFRLPYLGFSQSVLQRTVSGGFYFYLQGVVDTHLSPLLRVCSMFKRSC